MPGARTSSSAVRPAIVATLSLIVAMWSWSGFTAVPANGLEPLWLCLVQLVLLSVGFLLATIAAVVAVARSIG